MLCNEANVGKSEAMKISREPRDIKENWSMGNISVLLGITVTNIAKGTRKIKYQHCHGKSSIQQKKKKFFHRQIGFKFEDDSLITAWYGDESWTLRKEDQKYLKSF